MFVTIFLTYALFVELTLCCFVSKLLGILFFLTTASHYCFLIGDVRKILVSSRLEFSHFSVPAAKTTRSGCQTKSER